MQNSEKKQVKDRNPDELLLEELQAEVDGIGQDNQQEKLELIETLQIAMHVASMEEAKNESDKCDLHKHADFSIMTEEEQLAVAIRQSQNEDVKRNERNTMEDQMTYDMKLSDDSSIIKKELKDMTEEEQIEAAMRLSKEAFENDQKENKMLDVDAVQTDSEIKMHSDEYSNNNIQNNITENYIEETKQFDNVNLKDDEMTSSIIKEEIDISDQNKNNTK